MLYVDYLNISGWNYKSSEEISFSWSKRLRKKQAVGWVKNQIIVEMENLIWNISQQY